MKHRLTVFRIPDTPITGCDGLDPAPYLSESDGQASFVCYNNQGYWIADFQDKSGDFGSPCDPSLLPGLTSLDGTNWGGVTRDDIVAG
jgi:hypothetical protein